MTEEELNQLVEKSKGIVSEVIKQLNDMNWFVRKPNGLLYYYKYKPSLIKNGNVIFPIITIIPIRGDKETLFKEESNSFSFIPKNVVIHRDDLSKYKNKELTHE